MTRVAESFPKEFTHLEDLFDLFSECLRPLRIDALKQLVLHIQLPSSLQAAFLADVALPFLPNIPTRLHILDLTQDDLIEFFLPCHANSTQASENAKFSFLIECLLANFYERGMLTYSSEFLVAEKKGIQSRRDHAISDGRGRSKTAVGGANGRDELKWSSDRIHCYLELAQSELLQRSRFFCVQN
jgi:hypothetical protein